MKPISPSDSPNPSAAHTEATQPPSLAPLQFLHGRWEAISPPGEAMGGFSFEPQLLGRVLVRTNYADYPATQERPAFRHEDLMVIYLDAAQALRADYFDSEGHVIRYAGQVGAANEVTFTSPPTSTGPGFRLAYRLTDADVLAGVFEITSPDAPNTFSPYLAWSAQRAK